MSTFTYFTYFYKKKLPQQRWPKEKKQIKQVEIFLKWASIPAPALVSEAPHKQPYCPDLDIRLSTPHWSPAGLFPPNLNKSFPCAISSRGLIPVSSAPTANPLTRRPSLWP